VSTKAIHLYQTRAYMNAREIGLTQANAAYIAEISERTGQRIEAGQHQPNRGKVADRNSTQDPLGDVWDKELEPMLKQEPRLKPMTLFEYLQDTYPGKYPQVLRTIQRRVQTWKALHGPSPEVMFELRHEPGVMGLSDFTQLKGMEITIAGKPFEHLIYHYRLAYSGWQYAQIIQGGESFIALAEGLQNALTACGGVPKQHRTDSLSAAYRNLGGNKSLTRLYDELCDHYRMQPTRNNTGVAHENGAIESPHGHLKNRIKQAIYLRGSNDFQNLEEYGLLIEAAVAKLNQQCQQKYEQEKTQLRSLPKYRIPDYEILTACVSTRSTVEVRCVLYTVPSRLIGRQLELHLYHDKILSESFPQLTVTQHDLSSYDQLIDANTSDHRSEFKSPDHNSPESPPAPNSPPQAAPINSHARSLGVLGTPGYAGAMVLCQILTGIMRTRNSTPQRSSITTKPVRGSTSQRKKFFQL
jgi:hypothetical protein